MLNSYFDKQRRHRKDRSYARIFFHTGVLFVLADSSAWMQPHADLRPAYNPSSSRRLYKDALNDEKPYNKRILIILNIGIILVISIVTDGFSNININHLINYSIHVENRNETHLIPEMLKVFPNGNGILQQDLATCHTSKKVKKFMVKNSIKTLKWPGNSPDLNPIENLWAIVKKRLRKHYCTTKTKLTTTILQIWIEDTEIQNICKNLVDSMPNRVQKVIAARGGHIKY